MSTSSTCTFGNAKGHELSARLERPNGPTLATALFAHCFTCGIDLRVERRLTKALTDQGFAVLSFDFTGLGRSGGTFAESSFSANVDDLHAAAAYLAEVEAAPTLLVGHSLGGAAVLSAAPAMNSVRALATIGAPADPGHVRALLVGDLDRIRRDGAGKVTIAGRTFELDTAFLDELEMANPVSTLAGFSGATLFMHAPLDDTVGIQNAETLYRAARHPKSFISLDGADHLLTREADSTYVATVIAAWASRYMASDQTELTRTETFEAGAGATATNSGGWPTALESRGFRFMSDQPRTKGGTETGPTPYDFLSMALATCTAMTVRAYAERKKWDIGDVDVTVTHHREHAEDCLKHDQTCLMDRLEIELRVSREVPEEQRTALVRVAGRCPVHLTLTGHVEIDIAMSDAAPPIS